MNMPAAFLEVRVEQMRLTLHQVISEKMGEREIKAAIDAAVTPEILQAKISRAIGEALEREARDVADAVVRRNPSLKKYLMDACNAQIDQKLKDW